MIKTFELNKTEMQVLDHLHEVIDPEIELNIVDLGLVYSVAVSEDVKTISVEMTLTTQFCPMGASIVNSVEETLKDYFPDYAVNVELVFDPKWSAEMISDEGKSFLEG